MTLRPLLLALTAASVAASLLVGAHLYLARRLVLEPAWPEPFRSALLAAIALLGTSLVLSLVSGRLLPPRRAKIVVWSGAVWMGLAFLLLTLLSFSDLALWLVGPPAWAQSGDGLLHESGARLRALVVGGLAGGGAVLGLRNALRPPPLRRVEHRLARWPRPLDGFRIVQISDLHIGGILDVRFARHLVDRCNALEPDLLVVTGDLVDGSVDRLADEVAPLAELRARHGVFFVTGNHDHYSGAQVWCRTLEKLGLSVLRNSRVTIARGETSFELAGVDDHRGGHFDGVREDLPRALAGRDPNRTLVLLAHDPSTFRSASRMGVDLQLSGHTHGGQIWPFSALVRLVVPFVAGVYEREGARLYVSRGSGFWGPPMRLFAPAEITEHVLRPGAQQQELEPDVRVTL
ncbi:MAG: metallophosphoesterase [Myxococcota bacterium]